MLCGAVIFVYGLTETSNFRGLAGAFAMLYCIFIFHAVNFTRERQDLQHLLSSLHAPFMSGFSVYIVYLQMSG